MSERDDKQDIAQFSTIWAMSRDSGDWVKLRMAVHRHGVVATTSNAVASWRHESLLPRAEAGRPA